MLDLLTAQVFGVRLKYRKKRACQLATVHRLFKNKGVSMKTETGSLSHKGTSVVKSSEYSQAVA